MLIRKIWRYAPAWFINLSLILEEWFPIVDSSFLIECIIWVQSDGIVLGGERKMPLSWYIIKRLVEPKYSTSSVAIVAKVMASWSCLRWLVWVVAETRLPWKVWLSGVTIKQRWQVQMTCGCIWQLAHSQSLSKLEKYNNNNKNKIVWHVTLYIVFDS